MSFYFLNKIRVDISNKNLYRLLIKLTLIRLKLKIGQVLRGQLWLSQPVTESLSDRGNRCYPSSTHPPQPLLSLLTQAAAQSCSVMFSFHSYKPFMNRDLTIMSCHFCQGKIRKFFYCLRTHFIKHSFSPLYHSISLLKISTFLYFCSSNTTADEAWSRIQCRIPT